VVWPSADNGAAADQAQRQGGRELTDKSTSLILEALGRAAAEPDGISLFASKSAPGLFAASPAAKLAAQRCKADGFLRTVRTESRGKSVHELCALTEKGLAYLLAQANPKQVIEDFIRALDARQGQLNSILEAVRHTQKSLESIRTVADGLVSRSASPAAPIPSANGTHYWPETILAQLLRRDSGASGDYPLPDLYRHALQSAPHMTIGQFHDALRKLHEQERIYLHPWTGPLYDLPEPVLALLVGHEIAYYASIRNRSEC
jgi:hypothetical protein